MIVLDTSALIRFFTKDIPSDADKVKKLLEGNEKLIIPDVVFPELEYVLSSNNYQVTREKISEAFFFLTSRKNIVITNELKLAVEVFKKSKLDMADCIIVASAEKKELFSLDKRMISEYSKISA
jgi:predicted nucleic acid-binding protein